MNNKKKETSNFLKQINNTNKNKKKSKKKGKFIKKIIKKFKIPLKEIKIIHIAGTNGKGSVASIISQILVQKRYNTGLFTSPHLQEITERIKVNNKNIEQKDFNLIFKKIIALVKKSKNTINFFEILTSLALIYFKKKSCKIIIIETGIGGRLDVTNYIKDDKISIITKIGYDHEKKLGTSISNIAKEKAGIIKKKNICIISKQNQNLYKILKQKAKEKQAKTFTYKNDFSFHKIKITENKINFKLIIKNQTLNISSKILSIHQIINLSTSITSIKAMGIKITEKEINKSLENFQIKGRFQIIKKNPYIILDVAHNTMSIKSLINNLKIRFKNKKRKFIIIGISAGKNYKAIINQILKFFDVILITNLNFNIAENISKNIYNYCLKANKKCLYHKSFVHSYKYIKNNIKKSEILVITGSFYLVGEALDHFQNNSKS